MKKSWTNPGEYTPCNIGGQALLEGVMMRGATSTAICCRDENGELVVATERNAPRTHWYNKVPVVRGAISFFSSLFIGIKYIAKSAEVYSKDEEGDSVLGTGGMILAVLLAFALAIGLFVVIPTVLNYLVIDLLFDLSNKVNNEVYVLIMCLFKGIIKVGILVLYLFLTSLLKDIKRTFMYHGAEHRTINCYEHNLELTVENVQKCSTRHARCGTTFMFYTVFLSIIVLAFISWLLSILGLNTTMMQEAFGETIGKIAYNAVSMGVGLVCLPIIAGVSYEVLKAVAKAPDNAFFRALKAPGFALQALTTKLPDDDMAEAAITAFKKVLEMDTDQSVPAMDFYQMTQTEAREYIKSAYQKAGITEESETDWLLCDVLGVKRNELHTVSLLSVEQSLKIRACVAKRVSGLPLDYVTGKSDFLGYEIKVDERVHLPRMETEVTALEAVRIINEKGFSTALDLMTGSGIIARALVEKTTAKVTATDLSEDALAVARTNLPESVTVINSDVLGNIDGTFDLIVSNPPYIASAVIDTLQEEVKCQPRMSLDGGEDGLKFYRIIAGQAPAHLSDGGYIVLEIGHDQAEAVRGILSENFDEIEVVKDLSGSDRVVVAKKK